MLIIGPMVETLVKHMTQKYLDEMDGVKIGGAPSWYMEPMKNEMCVFTHQKGGLSSIDIAKKNATYKMTKKINDVIEIVIYENKTKVKDKNEQKLFDRFKIDDNLGGFVKKSMRYSKVSYEDEVNIAFVRACIPAKTIEFYQKARLMDINEAVLGAKSDSAFDSLDNEFGDESTKDKYDF